MTGLLDPSGPFARLLSGFEARPSQSRMMDLVGGAFRDDGVLLVEAGTGTGKTFAYLAPAVLWASETGEKVVISTHTIALQEQILHKDLPLVAAALNIPVKAALMKGRGNYVCRRKVHEAVESSRRLIDPDPGAYDAESLARIAEWARTHEDGSRSELGFVPPADLWEAVKSDRDSCLRTRCQFHQSCFYYRARRAAAAADVVIANHHLVFADLAVKAGIAESTGEGDRNGEPQGGVLPPYKRLILDEAHHLEEVAGSWFGAEASRTGVLRLLTRLSGGERRGVAGLLPSLARALVAHAPSADESIRHDWTDAADLIDRRLAPYARLLADVAVTTFAHVQSWAVRQERAQEKARDSADGDANERRVRLPDEPDERWRLDVQPALDRLCSPHDGLLGLADELKTLHRRLGDAGEDAVKPIAGPLVDLLGAAFSLERAAASMDLVGRGEGSGPRPVGHEYVRWVETDLSSRSNVRLIATPIDLGPLLSRHLFGSNATVVCTSATLFPGGDAEGSVGASWLARRLGADRLVDGRLVTEALPSPFDWEKQALIAVPTDLPAPDEDGFEEQLAERVLDAVLASEGGAFVLFTSYKLLGEVHERLAPRLAAAGLAVVRQGDMERHALLDAFRRDGSSVLFATDSFWEGVDVPGDPLRNVIITRLPFRVPTDPVLVARSERIEAAGGNAFAELTVPAALVKFRQGLGRLIRTRSDRGILVVLDKRIFTRRYGPRFRAALPPCRVETGDSGDVFRRAREFLRVR